MAVCQASPPLASAGRKLNAAAVKDKMPHERRVWPLGELKLCQSVAELWQSSQTVKAKLKISLKHS